MRFTYEHKSHSSHILIGGETGWDSGKKQYRSTIIAQRYPDIRFDAWADDSALAGLLCCAKWMGYDMANVKVCDAGERAKHDL